MGMSPATYYVPEETLAGMQGLAEAWRTLEMVKPHKWHPPQFEALAPGGVVWLHRQLAAKAFRVQHTLPSLGYTLYDVRKKLKAEFQGTPGPELARLRREGVAFEEELWVPRLTFIGDSTIETLYREPHVGQSRILFLEVTFLLDGEQEMARKRGHTHLDDLLTFLKAQPDTLQNEHIVLKHFSMRYEKRLILKVLEQKLPADFRERVHILL
jgi:ribonuclease Z